MIPPNNKCEFLAQTTDGIVSIEWYAPNPDDTRPFDLSTVEEIIQNERNESERMALRILAREMLSPDPVMTFLFGENTTPLNNSASEINPALCAGSFAVRLDQNGEVASISYKAAKTESDGAIDAPNK